MHLLPKRSVTRLPTLYIALAKLPRRWKEVGAEDLSESEEVDDLPKSKDFTPELAIAEIAWDDDLSESTVDHDNMHESLSRPYLLKPCPLKFSNKDEARCHCLQFHVRTDRNIPSCQCAECGRLIDKTCFQPGCGWFFAKSVKGKRIQ
jgi:hypothetical protein